jgi:hypothetical protein
MIETSTVLVEDVSVSNTSEYIEQLISAEKFNAASIKLDNLSNLDVNGSLSVEEIARLKITLKKAVEEKHSRDKYGTRSRVFYPTYGKSGPNGPRHGNGHR